MDVVAALTRLGGVSGRAALLEMVTRRSLDAAVRSGSVGKASRTLYVLASVDEAEVAARRLHGAVSHLSAALAWGWKLKHPPARPVVAVPRNRHPVEGDSVEVKYAVLTAEELSAGRTTRIRTAVDCARTLPFDQALAVVDSALRSGKVTRTELTAAALVGPRTGRPAALRVFEAANGMAANPFESVLRAIAMEVPGLRVVPQGAVGTVGHADLTDPDLRIAIEAESFEFHALPEAFRHDIRRYTAMTRLGWLVVRFVWEDVMARPAYVREVLADLVALRTQKEAVGRATA